MSSAASRDLPRFTIEQYLALERKAEFKSEFDDGFIEAMSGATREHNLIAGNLFRKIGNQLDDRQCEVYMGDMRVWVGPSRRYVYPDVVAVCGQPQFQDRELDTLLNPVMIVEVLSESTEKRDRGSKFAAYRRLESLREYVLIDQQEVLVERYTRRGEEWVLTAFESLEDTLSLTSIGCAVPLSEIYAEFFRAPRVGLRGEEFKSPTDQETMRDANVLEAQRQEEICVSTPTRLGTNIKRLDLLRVAVPLKRQIKHASHSRSVSENLVVRVELANGQVGYGEGVPRPYVTGETVESTWATLTRQDWARIVGKPATFVEVVRCLETLTLPETEADPRGMAGNSARCALELALLDAYGRFFGEPVGRAVDLADVPGLRRFPAPGRVRYSAAITAESSRKELVSALKFRLYGFRHVKAKVGVEGQDDVRRVKWIRRILGYRIDLRLDANEAWPAAELLDRVEPLRRFSISALEQPVPHAEVQALADLRRRLRIAVMLDESLCGYPDAVSALKLGTANMFNVRLSKCGGILPSLRIIGLAQRSGLGLQLGCHPGETAILSAAGRQVASRIEGIHYVEGSYDRHILKANLTRDDITFGYGGWAKPLVGPGLGIQVHPEALEAMTTDRREITYD